MSDVNPLRIGIVATRLAGTDGVSLESAKWSATLEALGHTCYFFAGESDRPADRSMVLDIAHFDHPDVRAINEDLFGSTTRSPKTSQAVHELRRRLNDALTQFVRRFDIDLLIVENALSLPMHVPMGLALTELVAETGLPTIAHHHDFPWERPRYDLTAAADYLQAAFPPAMSQIHHVVINTHAAHELARRIGMRCSLVPNVMNFESPQESPPQRSQVPTDELREAIGLKDEELLILQPTRIVPRKRIECAIDLVHWLDRPAALVVTHSSGDEGDAYRKYLVRYAEAMNVRLILAADRFSQKGGTDDDGRRLFSLADAYEHADLVTYPSAIEGFGNAFLEAIYYRRPLVMSAYDIFRADIKPKGFKVVAFDSFVSEATVDAARAILDDAATRKQWADRNYELARRHYSYTVLRECLAKLVHESMTGMF